EHGDVVALAQRVERGQLAPGVIAAGVVAEQVTDRPQAEDLLERVARLLTHHLGQRIAQRGHVAQHRSVDRHSGTQPTECSPSRGAGRSGLWTACYSNHEALTSA